jgi:membrane protein
MPSDQNTVPQVAAADPTRMVLTPGHAKALSDTPAEAVVAMAKGHEFNLRTLGQVALDAARAWSAHRAASKGAALALYTLFSLAPMLVLVVAVAGVFFGVDAVREVILKQMSGVLGSQGAEAMKAILAGAHYQSDSKLAALVSSALLLVGATSAFSELKDSLDELWEVPRSRSTGLWTLVRERFLSFGLVLVLALMLLISLAVSTLLSVLGDYWVGGVTNHSFIVFAKVTSTVASFAIVTMMFAAIYKYLPAVRIAWRDVLLGSLITAVLFVTGKYVIGLYLGTTNFSSGYGAAGSLVLLVTWIYYSAQIFFYGALFTHEHAVRSGRATPTPIAKLLDEKSTDDKPAAEGTAADGTADRAADAGHANVRNHSDGSPNAA